MEKSPESSRPSDFSHPPLGPKPAIYRLNLHLLGVLIAYAAGILFSFHYSDTALTSFIAFFHWFLLLASFSLWWIIEYWEPEYQTRYLYRTAFVLLGTMLFLGGSARLADSYLKVPANHIYKIAAYKKGKIRGKVIPSPVNYPRKNEFYLRVERFTTPSKSRRVEGLIKIYTVGFRPRVKVGDRLEVFTKPYPPPSSRVPGLFDYRRYLRRKDIRLVGKLTSPRQITLLNNNSPSPWEENIYYWRRYLGRKIKARLPTGTGNFLRCLFLGERHRLGYQRTQAFRKTGLSHLLSISGLHIGILVAAFLLIFKFLFRFLPPKWYRNLSAYILPSRLALILTIIPVVFYAQMVGGRIPTVRALIMLIAYIALVNFEQKINLYNVLILAAFLILLARPISLFEVSFQLSFTAVFFIVLGLDSIRSRQPFLLRTLSRQNRYLVMFKTYLEVSLIASLATAPLIAYYFKKVSLISPLANFLAVPFIYLILPVGFLGLAFSPVFPALSFGLLRISSALARLLLWLVDWLASPDLSAIHLGKPMLLLVFTIYALWIAWVLRQKKMVFWLLFPAFTGWLLFFLIPSGLKIHLLDLKDKIWVMEFPGNKNLAVDGGGGGRRDYYNRNPLRFFLAERGISRLSWVVCLHNDANHFRGLEKNLERYQVPALWYVDPPQFDYWGTEQWSPGKLMKIIPRQTINPEPDSRISFWGPKSGFMKITYRDFTGILTANLPKSRQPELIKFLSTQEKVNLLVIPYLYKRSRLWKFLKARPPDITVVRSYLGAARIADFQSAGRGKLYSLRKSGTITLVSRGEGVTAELYPNL